jgi:lauroyl/myristoyl acyltransferase
MANPMANPAMAAAAMRTRTRTRIKTVSLQRLRRLVGLLHRNRLVVLGLGRARHR